MVKNKTHLYQKQTWQRSNINLLTGSQRWARRAKEAMANNSVEQKE
jgi:hypothetical protein